MGFHRLFNLFGVSPEAYLPLFGQWLRPRFNSGDIGIFEAVTWFTFCLDLPDFRTPGFLVSLFLLLFFFPFTLLKGGS
jgi:hypothetical protein